MTEFKLSQFFIFHDDTHSIRSYWNNFRLFPAHFINSLLFYARIAANIDVAKYAFNAYNYIDSKKCCQENFEGGNAMKENLEIRQKIEGNGIRYWQIAKRVGHSPDYFAKLLRTELKPELRQKVLNAIDEILNERSKP